MFSIHFLNAGIVGLKYVRPSQRCAVAWRLSHHSTPRRPIHAGENHIARTCAPPVTTSLTFWRFLDRIPGCMLFSISLVPGICWDVPFKWATTTL